MDLDELKCKADSFVHIELEDFTERQRLEAERAEAAAHLREVMTERHQVFMNLATIGLHYAYPDGTIQSEAIPLGTARVETLSGERVRRKLFATVENIYDTYRHTNIIRDNNRHRDLIGERPNTVRVAYFVEAEPGDAGNGFSGEGDTIGNVEADGKALKIKGHNLGCNEVFHYASAPIPDLMKKDFGGGEDSIVHLLDTSKVEPDKETAVKHSQIFGAELATMRRTLDMIQAGQQQARLATAH